MTADTIKIESDEDGFWLVLEMDGEFPLRVKIEDPEALYDTVKAEIGPWLYERDNAYQEWRVSKAAGEVSGEFAYEPTDPKHPRYHSTHVEIWDAREKGLI